MAAVDTIKKNIVPLENIPQSIRDWLGSDVLKFSIINLNSRLNLKGWKITIIPELILEITVKEISPEEFIPELARRLELSYSTAGLIAKTIYEQLLKPIQRQLKNELGVDLAQIFAPTAEAAPLFPKEESAAIISPPEPELAPTTAQIGQEIPPFDSSRSTPLMKGRIIPPQKIEAPPSAAETPKPEQSAILGAPEPHIIYKEIKTFKVPITISEQKSAALNNAPKIVKENPPAIPPMPPQQIERMSLQQLLESKKNNAGSVQKQTVRSNIPQPPLSAEKQTLPADKQATPAVPPRFAPKPVGDIEFLIAPKLTHDTELRQNPPVPQRKTTSPPPSLPTSERMGTQKPQRIPIKPEPKTATMLPKNLRQNESPKPASSAGSPQARLTKARIVHYSDLRTPLNRV